MTPRKMDSSPCSPDFTHSTSISLLARLLRPQSVPPAMNKKQIQLKKKEKERKDAAGVKSATSKESLAKQAKDASAYVCQSCRQTFMVTSKSKQLIEHCDAKHPKLPREQCFPELPDMLAREATGGGKK